MTQFKSQPLQNYQHKLLYLQETVCIGKPWKVQNSRTVSRPGSHKLKIVSARQINFNIKISVLRWTDLKTKFLHLELCKTLILSVRERQRGTHKGRHIATKIFQKENWGQIEQQHQFLPKSLLSDMRTDLIKGIDCFLIAVSKLVWKITIHFLNINHSLKTPFEAAPASSETADLLNSQHSQHHNTYQFYF